MTTISLFTTGIMILIFIYDFVRHLKHKHITKQNKIIEKQIDNHIKKISSIKMSNYSKANFDFPNLQTVDEIKISNTGVELGTIAEEIEIKKF